jgi:hypothetical protein
MRAQESRAIPSEDGTSFSASLTKKCHMKCEQDQLKMKYYFNI